MINRGRLEIMAHVLAFCEQPRLKTQVMYHANITFRQFEAYATLLSSQGLLTREADGYVSTEKGRRFVQAFSQLQGALEGEPVGIPRGSYVQMRRGKSNAVAFAVQRSAFSTRGIGKV